MEPIRNRANRFHPTDSPATIFSVSNKVKKVKFFKNWYVSPALEIICINKKTTGTAVENPIDLDDSLNILEKKKVMPQMVNMVKKAPQFSIKKAELSKAPGNFPSENMMPLNVTMAMSKNVVVTKKMACVNANLNRVFGVDNKNAIDPLSTILAINRFPMEIT